MTTTIEEYLEKVQMLQRRAMGLADFNIMLFSAHNNAPTHLVVSIYAFDSEENYNCLCRVTIMPDEPNKDIEPIRELVRIIETLEA